MATGFSATPAERSTCLARPPQPDRRRTPVDAGEGRMTANLHE
jgi:hypothetical protein